MKALFENIFLLFLALTLSVGGCGNSEPEADPPADLAPTFTHKMMKPTGENIFASLAYECSECSFEQFSAIEPPDGWTKGPTQVLLPIGELRSLPALDGVAASMDFVPEIAGNEYKLIAKNLEGRLIEPGNGGLVVEAQVMRDTLLRFPAESRVHELTDPNDNIFVLFAHHIDPVDLESINHQDADALAYFSSPEGWTYSTRILDEDLVLDSEGVVTVLAFRGAVNSTWEKR